MSKMKARNAKREASERWLVLAQTGPEEWIDDDEAVVEVLVMAERGTEREAQAECRRRSLNSKTGWTFFAIPASEFMETGRQPGETLH